MEAGVPVVVRAVETGVRSVRMRLPFRFGAYTLTACPQLFVRVEVEVTGHGTATGWAADLMVPKWFDKRPEFSPATNVEQLVQSVGLARAAYTNAAATAPFDLFCRLYPELNGAARAVGLTDLSGAFGQAIVDRAVIDAVCRALDVSFFDAARRNAFGFSDTSLVDDMRGWDWSAWLAQLQPLRRIDARHTIGLLDELDAVRAAIEQYGYRYFKIKLGGNPATDLERLRSLLAVLGEVRYTVDANEQYADVDALRELVASLGELQAPLYIEQPLPRERSMTPALKAIQSASPLLMDEADGSLDAFVRGREFGWTGVSSKGCKGLYKSLINRARCERWNREEPSARFFMSAEDLTCQAGVCVQQDLALVALLGLTHSERNGHYYGDGLASATAAERNAFVAAHPDLYEMTATGEATMRIRGGIIEIDSLFRPGFAHSADPDLTTLQPLASAAALL